MIKKKLRKHFLIHVLKNEYYNAVKILSISFHARRNALREAIS